MYIAQDPAPGLPAQYGMAHVPMVQVPPGAHSHHSAAATMSYPAVMGRQGQGPGAAGTELGSSSGGGGSAIGVASGLTFTYSPHPGTNGASGSGGAMSFHSAPGTGFGGDARGWAPASGGRRGGGRFDNSRHS